MNPKHPDGDNYIDDEEDEFEWEESWTGRGLNPHSRD